MIEIINIMPNNYLYEFYLTNQMSTSSHMAMAHLVLEDDNYSRWSKEQRNLGRSLILDNSASYFGRALDNDSLMNCINMINPNEVVLPDVLGNFDETIKRSLKFLNQIKNIGNLKIMAVPQGDSLEEYIECYNIFSSDDRIKVIGLSYTVDNIFLGGMIPLDYVSSREYLIKLLYENNIINSNKEHHLLGLGNSGQIELQKLNKFSFIRSCDSNTAYITAKQNIEIFKGVAYRKPKGSINFEDKFEKITYKLLIENIKTLAESGARRK